MGLPVQLNYYSNTDTSIIDLMNTTDGVIIGHYQVSLTNYNNTSLPAIAIGSVVENNGCMVKFTTECAITDPGVSDGTVYIYLVPSGDPALGTATVTPTFTNTAPTWSDSKQGWYGTSGSANYRYLEYQMQKSSSVWSDKKSLKVNSNIDGRNVFHASYLDSTGTLGEFFDLLDPYIPTVGDKIIVNGCNFVGVYMFIYSYAERYDSTTIRLHAISTQGVGLQYYQLVTGSSTSIGLVSAAW